MVAGWTPMNPVLRTALHPLSALTLCSLIAAMPPAMATDIYRCQNANGTYTFSDQPCGRGARKMDYGWGGSRTRAPSRVNLSPKTWRGVAGHIPVEAEALAIPEIPPAPSAAPANQQ